MAILFRVDSRGETPRERLLNLLDFLYEWLNNIEFKVNKIELWENSYLIEEDGKKEGEYVSIERLKGKIASYTDITRIDRLITIFEGVIQLSTPVELRSNNGSVELESLPARLYTFDLGSRRALRAQSLFYTFTIPDWRLFIENDEFRSKISGSVHAEHTNVKLRALIVGKNQFASHDVRYQVFCYYLRRRDFIEDLLKTIKEEIEETKTGEYERKRIPDIITPYNLDFIASTLDSYDDAIEHRLKEFYIKSELAYEVGSVKLRATTENAFEEFYNSFRDDFVEFFRKEFPDVDKIRKVLYRWVGKISELSEFG
jgi:hypothetical protein